MANVNIDTFGAVFSAMFSDEKHGGGSESGEACQRPNTSPRCQPPQLFPPISCETVVYSSGDATTTSEIDRPGAGASLNAVTFDEYR
jgi:hypothetical protein